LSAFPAPFAPLNFFTDSRLVTGKPAACVTSSHKGWHGS
jgi:hypothetical protein